MFSIEEIVGLVYNLKTYKNSVTRKAHISPREFWSSCSGSIEKPICPAKKFKARRKPYLQALPPTPNPRRGFLVPRHHRARGTDFFTPSESPTVQITLPDSSLVHPLLSLFLSQDSIPFLLGLFLTSLVQKLSCSLKTYTIILYINLNSNFFSEWSRKNGFSSS